MSSSLTRGIKESEKEWPDVMRVNSEPLMITSFGFLFLVITIEVRQVG